MLGLDDDDALRHLDHRAARRRPTALERLQLIAAGRVPRVGPGLARARREVGQELLAAARGLIGRTRLERPAVVAQRPVIRAEQVVLGRARVVAAVVVLLDLLLVAMEAPHDVLRGTAGRDVGRLRPRLRLRRHHRRLEERRRARVGRVRPAVAEHVRLPVVELQLRGGADLLLGPLRVLDVGQADRDLILSGLLDLGLRHAERVGALADRVDGVVDRLRGDLRDLRRRPALVDQLGAAAQVESEPRLLRQRRAGDDQQAGEDEQECDEGEDAQVAVSRGHLGVRTSSSPPSSS